RVMVVVEFLAADQHADRNDVARRVLRFEIAVAEVVADAVDHAGGPERNPDELRRVDREPGAEPEQRDVDYQHEPQADQRMPAIKIPLEPIIRRAAAVDVERVRIGRGGAIEPDAAEQHAPDAPDLRAVRISIGLALRVMLTMHGDPLARDHARRDPEPEAEEMARDRMQIERPMSLMAMQEDRDAGDRHVREQQRDAKVAPGRKMENAAERHTELHLSLSTDFTEPAAPECASNARLPPVPSSSYVTPESRRASRNAPRRHRKRARVNGTGRTMGFGPANCKAAGLVWP